MLILLLVPIGAFTFAGVMLLLKVQQQLPNATGSLWQRIWKTDPVGNTFFSASIVCLLLAIQSNDNSLSSGRAIVLFVIFGVTAVGFVGWQWYKGKDAAIPPHLTSHRTIIFATTFAFFIGSAIFVTLYYLPIWFQAVQGVTPIISAVHTLPLIGCQVLGTFGSGYLTTKFGYYTPFMYASAVLTALGCGLLYTLHVGEATSYWIGYQIALGFGIGFGFQQPTVAVQTSLSPADIPVAVALVYTSLYLGGAVFVSAGEILFSSELSGRTASLDIPGFDVARAVEAGATQLRNQVPPEYLHEVLVAYNGALTKVFELATILGSLSAIGALGMEWKNIKR